MVLSGKHITQLIEDGLRNAVTCLNHSLKMVRQNKPC